MNYGDLKSHFNDLLNRTDITTTLTTRFIDQGLARIQRNLRVPLMEKQQNYTISGNTPLVVLPNDFLEIINLYHSSGVQLTRIPMSTMRSHLANSFTGNPQFFTRQQANVLLFPHAVDGTLTLDYYGEVGDFADDTTETTLSKVAPDLIIYAGLTYAADYFLDERAQLFESKYTQFLNELQSQADDQELNGSTQVIQAAFNFERE